MNSVSALVRHTDDLWSYEFPLRFFGLDLGRRVSLLRISGNRLVIHSTGPFRAEHRRHIRKLGEPAILLDATTMHDTFSRTARATLPDLPYLVPEGFPQKACGAAALPLDGIGVLTGGEVEAVRLDGMRFLTEYACFHPASQTLIVADLLFNLDQATGYTRWAMRYLLGVQEWPAMDRPVRLAVRDRTAFMNSIQKILNWDFDRVIVAHGSVIEADGKRIAMDALARAGFML